MVVPSGLSCPTRDGRISRAGCAFCDECGSASYHSRTNVGIRGELLTQLPAIRARFKAARFLAYFQSHSNTYGSPEQLKRIYSEALSVPEIAGLCIGTRPDCLPAEVLEVLRVFSEKTHVTVELGIQSFENPTLEWLGRGHDRACALRALDELARLAPKVHVSVHLILGSPTDSPQAASAAAQTLSGSPVRSVKLHQLMVLENTELAIRFKKELFATVSLESYAERVLEFIQNLSPEICIERLCASATHRKSCLAPAWSTERWRPQNFIKSYLAERNCRQGSHWSQR